MRDIGEVLLKKIRQALRTVYNDADPKMDIIVAQTNKYLTPGLLLTPHTVRVGAILGPLDIAVRREDANKIPQGLSMAYIEDGTAKVAWLDIDAHVGRGWQHQYDIGPAIDVAIDYDGRWTRITSFNDLYFTTTSRWALVTYGDPYIALVKPDGSLTVQVGQGAQTTLAADNVTKISLMRSWKNVLIWNHDHGIIACYIRNGEVRYRSYAQQADGITTLWENERTLAEFESPEIQTLFLGGASGGTFTLGDGTTNTSAIAYNASAATIQTELEAIYGAGNVTVEAGTDFTITFAMAVGVSGLVADFTDLTGALNPLLSVAQTYGLAANVALFRTNDYRTGLLAEAGGQIHWAISSRNWAGMAIPDELILASISGLSIELTEVQHIVVGDYEPGEHYGTVGLQRQVPAELISAGVTNFSIALLYGISPVCLTVENSDAENILLTFDEQVFGAAGQQAAFSVVDENSISWSVLTVAQGAHTREVALTLVDFNNAAGDLTISYNNATGTMTGEAGQAVGSFSKAFTPVGLVPDEEDPPAPIAAWNE